MTDPEIIVDVTTAWLSGSSDVVAVHIPALRGAENRFMLAPADSEELERIAIANGYCPKCDGRGFLPVPFGTEMRGVPCQKCKGKGKPMTDSAIRYAQLKAYCRGWEGWMAADKVTPVPFSDDVVKLISREPVVAGVILSKAQELRVAFSEVEQGNSTSGPARASGEPTHPSTASPESDES